MIKGIFATLIGLVVVSVAVLAVFSPYVFVAVLVLYIAYSIGKWMLG